LNKPQNSAVSRPAGAKYRGLNEEIVFRLKSGPDSFSAKISLKSLKPQKTSESAFSIRGSENAV